MSRQGEGEGEGERGRGRGAVTGRLGRREAVEEIAGVGER